MHPLFLMALLKPPAMLSRALHAQHDPVQQCERSFTPKGLHAVRSSASPPWDTYHFSPLFLEQESPKSLLAPPKQ